MRMRGLLLAGAKMAAVAWGLGWALQLAGVAGWPENALSVLFLLGLADMAVAAGFNLGALLRRARDARAEVELDDRIGPDWRLVDGAAVPASDVEGYLRVRYPAGLSSWTPPMPPSVSFAEFGGGWGRMQAAISEKRLVPPLSPGWQDQGIEFPEVPAYSRRDRYGLRQPPFPVHFRTLPGEASLIDGVFTTNAVLESHTDPHKGCPVCDAWLREHGR